MTDEIQQGGSLHFIRLESGSSWNCWHEEKRGSVGLKLGLVDEGVHRRECLKSTFFFFLLTMKTFLSVNVSKDSWCWTQLLLHPNTSCSFEHWSVNWVQFREENTPSSSVWAQMLMIWIHCCISPNIVTNTSFQLNKLLLKCSNVSTDNISQKAIRLLGCVCHEHICPVIFAS